MSTAIVLGHGVVHSLPQRQNVRRRAKGGKKKNKSKTSKSSKQKNKRPPGVIDYDFYNSVAKAFVGLNPVAGDGSCFIYGGETSMTGETFGNVPDSGGGRNNLCTCDCKPSDSGVGCAGHGGINFRYGSLLWIDPYSSEWTGQMQAYQAIPEFELNFLGADTRLYPGGPAVYNVACTLQDCGGAFASVYPSSKLGNAYDRNRLLILRSRVSVSCVVAAFAFNCVFQTKQIFPVPFFGIQKVIRWHIIRLEDDCFY